MSAITIAGEDVLIGEWNGSGLLEYRVYSTEDWLSAGGAINLMGSPFSLFYIDNVLAKGDCVVSNRSVTLPDIDLETTDDPQIPTDHAVSLILALFDKATNRPEAILIPNFTVTAGDNSLDDLMA